MDDLLKQEKNDNVQSLVHSYFSNHSEKKSNTFSTNDRPNVVYFEII